MKKTIFITLLIFILLVISVIAVTVPAGTSYHQNLYTEKIISVGWTFTHIIDLISSPDYISFSGATVKVEEGFVVDICTNAAVDCPQNAPPGQIWLIADAEARPLAYVCT